MPEQAMRLTIYTIIVSVARIELNSVDFSHPVVLLEVPRDHLSTTLNYHSQFAGISTFCFNGSGF